MALNLSTLTSPATSGDVLAEALTTADFLEGVPVLRNLARGSQKGGDAKQDVALNQPKALPLIDGDGYYYGSGVANNHAYAPALGYSPSDDHSYYARCYISSGSSNFYILSTRANSIGGLSAFVDVVNGIFVTLNVLVGTTTVSSISASTIPKDTEFDYLITYNGSTNKVSVYIDGVTLIDDVTISTSTWNSTTPLFIGARGNSTTNYTQSTLNALGYIKQAKAFSSVVTPPTVATATPSLNVDFTAATNVRHGDTKFKCATGQVVTINKSGNDPATIIKKPVLRFSDASSTSLGGVLASNLTEGYYFAALSFLGSVGSLGNPRLFSVYSSGDTNADAIIFGLRGGISTSSGDLSSYKGGTGGGWFARHVNMGTRDRGDVLHEVKYLDDGTASGLVNNADNLTANVNDGLNSNKFIIGNNLESSSFDLEYLALFPATITDAQAEDVRNYINNRNNVFDLKDGFGYYFYDAQNAPVGNISSGSASWNGRIVGSDNGDTDKLATQGTSDDQPVGDGYVVTFADNTDHLEIPQVTQAGWQIVGTSRGTFAYRVNATAETELNLLGYGAPYRQTGDLYGIILLPETATGADIEAARKLLIDRGAADAFTENSTLSHWRSRNDIAVFNNVDFSGVLQANSTWRFTYNMTAFNVHSMPDLTYAHRAWSECSALESFNTLLPEVTDAREAWYNCSSLSSFGTTEIPNCSSFISSWQSCSALTSFPAGAKLGTAANNVNFTSAWRNSGLTSFSTPLPTATTVRSSFEDCNSLVSFDAQLPLAANMLFAFDGCSSLTSFDVSLPSASQMYRAWAGCSSLTDFSADVFSNWNPSTILSGVFDFAWLGCTALTADSVENILTSIDASGHYATTNKLQGGTALADAGIDIDYDGTTLSAATNAAIDSLSGKGWEVYINGVLVIPNILDLQPAAAYSLRSFDADADPNVVNVRRSSDGATSDFTASEVSDGTLVAFVGAGNDGHVTIWYDQSIGGTSHATQTVASSQPKLVDAGTLVTEGGLAALDFDGVNNYLELANGSISLPCSTFVTQKLDSVINSAYTFGIQQSGNNGGYVLRTNGYQVIDAASPFPSITLSGASDTDEHLIYVSAINGGKISGAVDGGTLEQSTDDITGWTSAAYATTIGRRPDQASLHLNGKLKELIHFNTDQSANRTGIEAEIMDTYSIS